ncbi:unnamed protein product [Brassicogethes aeneus]|uniref:BHLH domain-containing protein n=1 Tax=Brassicogethes aeneus TaxID=1431903 RepID=A0A9P0F8F2_BRAAE|nr:unnamed protein product [Brassicogethes aeneus]
MPRKRKLSMSDYASDDEMDDVQHHPQRNAANARERARMRVLSRAFCRLKTTLPWVPADTKLSKLDTLRLATSYIAHLRAVLMDQPLPNENFHKHPLTLTWPFSFQRTEGASESSSGGEAKGGSDRGVSEGEVPWNDRQNHNVHHTDLVSYYY